MSGPSRMAAAGEAQEGEKPAGAAGRRAAAGTPSLRLILLSTAVLVLAILLGEGDGMPGAGPGERAEAARLASAPEVSPYRGSEPFRAYNTTHNIIPVYSHSAEGWAAYLFGIVGVIQILVVGILAFPRDPVRQIQMLELSQTVGMISHGAFASYPRFPVPTPHHGVGSRIAAITRQFLFTIPSPVPVPLLASLAFARFKRTEFLVDVICVFYALLDAWPSLIGEFHVNERPTHNLRLLVLSLGSTASRHRAWGAIMAMFYIATGGPKLFPSFYRYWLWFGIYPSSTLADFPPHWFFSRGTDDGLHPNFVAQAFGFCGGALEVSLAVLMLIPLASNRRLRILLAAAVHLGIIFGRFDNGLSSWNATWLCEDVLHSLRPVHSAGWAELSPAAAAVVAAQGTLTLLFFLGHGSYHSGMSHHTGNFRMQWLLFHDDASWERFEGILQPLHGKACQHGPLHGFPTCVHSWGHGTHYPSASFVTFLYALNGGTYMAEVLPPGVAIEEEGFGEGLEKLGPHREAIEEAYVRERRIRSSNDQAFMKQVDVLVGGFRRPTAVDANGNGTAPGRPRAVYLGFASGASVWDDSFYEPLVGDLVRKYAHWRPGQVHFVEVDRQRPWRRTRRLRVWDLSQDLPPSPRSQLDWMLGSSPNAHLVADTRLVVRRPFPLM